MYHSFTYYSIPDPTNVTVSPSGPVTINETDNVILTCQGFGVPLPTLTWLSNETMLGSGGGPLELSLLTNVTDEVEISVSAGLDAEGRAVTVSVLTLFTLMKVEENITYTCNGDNGVVNNIGAVSSLSVSLIIQGNFMSIFVRACFTFNTKST